MHYSTYLLKAGIHYLRYCARSLGKDKRSLKFEEVPYCLGPLKGQCHEILLLAVCCMKICPPSPWFITSSRIVPRTSPPGDWILRCGPPPRGSNPMVWPLPQDRILWCGPPHGIKSYSVNLPAGLNPMVWPPSGTTSEWFKHIFCFFYDIIDFKINQKYF